MIIYLLRHGQAGPGVHSDFDRELTAIGVQSSFQVGRFCEKMSIHFSHALVSPLVRAQQTMTEVFKSVPPVTHEQSEHLTPESDPRNLLELLQTFPNNSRVLLVSHEPFVSRCISLLISGSESAQVMMKTASFACIETLGSPERGNGTLQWLVTSEAIKHSV